jgi:hypothetical protein
MLDNQKDVAYHHFMVKPNCTYCGEMVQQSWSAINRAVKYDKPIYCDRTCAGLGRRSGKTGEQKKEHKRLYDLQYRQTSATLKTRKSIWFKKTYDPIKAAEKRKETMPRHIEYCRRPEYKEWKRNYDQRHLAEKQYGEFAETVIILRQLEKEVMERISKEDINIINNTLNKKQTRIRDYERFNSN